MNFWETVKGHALADILMHNLPQIADSLQELTEEVKDLRKENAELKEAISGLIADREQDQLVPEEEIER